MDTSIKQIRESILPILRRYGVSKAALFGSIVADQMRADSDEDIFKMVQALSKMVHQNATIDEAEALLKD